jgi:hypothetical protein
MRAYREEGFPMTVIRPSLTYGDLIVPLAINSWLKSYTAIDRMRKGLPLIVPGDGLTLWTITHNSDFAKGLRAPGPPRGHGPRLPYHLRRGPDLEPDLPVHGGGRRRRRPKVCPHRIRLHRDLRPFDDGHASRRQVKHRRLRQFQDAPIRARLRSDHALPRRDRRTVAWFDADPSRRQVDPRPTRVGPADRPRTSRGLEAAVRDFGPPKGPAVSASSP